jgi:hypothetical protein
MIGDNTAEFLTELGFIEIERVLADGHSSFVSGKLYPCYRQAIIPIAPETAM